jgi:3'-5' exonuclease
MIKQFLPETCAFDCEWVPCADTARRLLNLDASTSERETFEVLWQTYSEKSELDNPSPDGKPNHPFLKLALCKIVSIAAVFRSSTGGNPKLELYSRAIDECTEPELIHDFLERVAYKAPNQGFQLWGYNSTGSDLPILKQRAIALGVACPNFSRRPDKPWGGLDYHSSHSDAHMDIFQLLGNFGRGGAAYPKLKEFAAACGIPCKFDVEGSDVADLYLDGRIRDIATYNQVDAIVTHLLMLKIAFHTCHLNAKQYGVELAALEDLLEERVDPGSEPLAKFLAAWQVAITAPSTSLCPPIDDGIAATTMGEVPANVSVSTSVNESARVQTQWSQIIARVQAQSGIKAAALLRGKQDVRVASDCVTIVFTSDFHRTEAENSNVRPVIEAVLGEILGRPIHCEWQTGDCAVLLSEEPT